MRTLAINVTVAIFFIVALNAVAKMMCGIAPQLYGDACPAGRAALQEQKKTAGPE